jgi:hypothetical protein
MGPLFFLTVEIPGPSSPIPVSTGVTTFYPIFVIPAKAGIQLIQIVEDSCLRRSDGFFDFLRDYQSLDPGIFLYDHATVAINHLAGNIGTFV